MKARSHEQETVGFVRTEIQSLLTGRSGGGAASDLQNGVLLLAPRAIDRRRRLRDRDGITRSGEVCHLADVSRAPLGYAGREGRRAVPATGGTGGLLPRDGRSVRSRVASA